MAALGIGVFGSHTNHLANGEKKGGRDRRRKKVVGYVIFHFKLAKKKKRGFRRLYLFT